MQVCSFYKNMEKQLLRTLNNKKSNPSFLSDCYNGELSISALYHYVWQLNNLFYVYVFLQKFVTLRSSRSASR